MRCETRLYMKRRFLSLSVLFVLLCFCFSLSGCEQAATFLDLLPGSASVSENTDTAVSDVPASSGDLLEIYVIDCGQGDSIFLSLPDETTMLIDGSTQSEAEAVLDFLDALDVRRLDYVVATHPHEDHIGGLDDCIEALEVGEVYMPDVVNTTQAFENLLSVIEEKNLAVTVPAGGEYLIGHAASDFSIQCLAPNQAEYDELNDYSIVLRIVYGERAVLLTGDAETVSENEMLMAGYDLSADVVKLGHHGSSTSSSEPFLRAVFPSYAVISCGADNSYGHPHQETLDLLSRFGISPFRTDTDGTVLIATDGIELTVRALGKP